MVETSTAFSKQLLAFEVIVDDYVALSARESLEQVALWLAGVAVLELAVVVMGLNDSLGVAQVQLGQSHEKGEGVVEPAHQQQALAVFHGQVLV